jgi:hypothetical protein
MPTKRENQFITEVIIRGFKYELWSLDDREPHPLGKMNGESGTLWVKEAGNGPHKEQTGEDEWIPWLDAGGNRDCWGIRITDGNSMKYKYDEYRISKHTSGVISLNNKEVYEVFGYDFDYCYNDARTKIYQLKELIYTHSVNLKNTPKEKGRKIFYKSMPAIIDTIYTDGGMIIRPDCKEEDKEYWWNQMIEPWHEDHSIDYWEESKHDNGIKVDILMSDIHWYRNDRLIKLNKIKRTTNEPETS